MFGLFSENGAKHAAMHYLCLRALGVEFSQVFGRTLQVEHIRPRAYGALAKSGEDDLHA